MTPQPLDIKKELLHDTFRVAIFGSARTPKEDPIYKGTYALAKEIAGLGADLITGGGPGIMDAASCGHRAGDPQGKVHTIGLNIRLPFEQELNPALEVFNEHERFSTRLDDFMTLSNVVVVMPGGIGTCLELFYTWQLIQVKHICKIPVILVGRMWREIIHWVIDYPLHDKYLDSSDLDFIVCVDEAADALALIKEAQEAYVESDGKACVNWKKYSKV